MPYPSNDARLNANFRKEIHAAKTAASWLDTRVLAQLEPGWEVSKADCVLEYWMEDLNALQMLVMNPEWASKAIKDHDKWCDIARAEVHIGHDVTCLRKIGEVVNLPKKPAPSSQS